MTTFRNLLLGSLLLFTSCESTRKAVYFSEGKERLVDSTITIAAPEVPEIRVQPDDILTINVTSISSLRIESDPVSIYREGGSPQGNSVAGRNMGYRRWYCQYGGTS